MNPPLDGSNLVEFTTGDRAGDPWAHVCSSSPDWHERKDTGGRNHQFPYRADHDADAPAQRTCSRLEDEEELTITEWSSSLNFLLVKLA